MAARERKVRKRGLVCCSFVVFVGLGGHGVVLGVVVGVVFHGGVSFLGGSYW
jgi:hypothetical protein